MRLWWWRPAVQTKVCTPWATRYTSISNTGTINYKDGRYRYVMCDTWSRICSHYLFLGLSFILELSLRHPLYRKGKKKSVFLMWYSMSQPGPSSPHANLNPTQSIQWNVEKQLSLHMNRISVLIGGQNARNIYWYPWYAITCDVCLKSPISLVFVMAAFKIRNLLLIHGTEASLCIVYDFLLQWGRGRIHSRFPHRSC